MRTEMGSGPLVFHHAGILQTDAVDAHPLGVVYSSRRLVTLGQVRDPLAPELGQRADGLPRDERAADVVAGAC